MYRDSTEGKDHTESSTEEEDQSPGLQLLRDRRSTTMSKPGEDTGLVDQDKISGKGWGRVKKAVCCQNNYPKAIWFILGNEFCERFSFYGMKAILVIYLTQWLEFKDNNATAIFHAFSMLCYFMPLFGGIISDSWLGKYRTILYLSTVYCFGNALMALTALPPPEWIGPMFALLLIAVGTGGIKPCVAAFGGDQFTADQEKEVNSFFSVFYFAINVGSLLSMLLTPVLRSDVRCFGGDCYPVAFGIPAVLMFVSLVIFICGRKMYKVYPPTGNVVSKMCKCIGHAIATKCKTKGESREHWLDFACDKYETKFIDDVKAVLHVLLLFLPLPVFWALFDQQGSRWTLQALHMDGDLGKFGHMKPDQMQALNPVLIIVFIPIFESIVYPLLDKCKIPNRPLQRMCAGGLLAAGSFVIAGFLQIKIESTMSTPLDSSQASLHFINASPCPVHIDAPMLNSSLHVAHGTEPLRVIKGTYTARITPAAECTYFSNPVNFDFTLEPEKYYHVVMGGKDSLQVHLFEYKVDKPKHGGAHVSLIYVSEVPPGNENVTLVEGKTKYSFNVTEFNATAFQEVDPGTYEVYAPRTATEDVKLSNALTVKSGGVYTVIIQHNVTNPTTVQMVDYEDAKPNQVPLLYQIPQYIVITVGEILFSISGLHFAYSQAPASMKSVLQAAWLMTVAGGNLIVVIIAEGQFISSQSVEFFVFASLMAVDMIIFAIMAYRYTYIKHEAEYDPVDFDNTGLVGDVPAPDLTKPEGDAKPEDKDESNI